MRTRNFDEPRGLLELEPGGVFSLHTPADVNRLFALLRFPGAHLGSGCKCIRETGGVRVTLYRSYREGLIWCCELYPDRDPSEPVVLTQQEALTRFGIKP